MRRILLAGGLAVCAMIFSAVSSQGQADQRALLDQYCVGCHNSTNAEANLDLQSADLGAVVENAETWEKVIRKLRAGMMPPPGAPRPDMGTFETFVVALETQIDRAAAAGPAMARPGIHRLNRTEYENAIYELLDLEIDAAAFLPVDDSAFGFDNVATSLQTSTALLEGYVAAAGKISRLALGRETAPGQWVYNAPQDLSQEEHLEGMPFGSRGGMIVRHFFPADGDYAFTWASVRGNTGQLFGHLQPDEQLEIAIDGERVRLVTWGDLENGIDLDDQRNEFRVRVEAGMRTVTATFLATTHVPIDDLNKHPERSVVDTTPVAGFIWSPQISRLSILGPYNGVASTDLPSRDKILVCEPADESQESACAEEILSTLVRRAYRRPSTSEDLESVMEFYNMGREKGGFEDGIEMGLRRILADPEFVYRREIEPAGLPSGTPYRITDLELASRLSFFLWSTIPDDELIDLASDERLRDPAVLEQQVERMLADPRAMEFVENFVGQWLQLRNLDSASPLVQGFPDFDDNLREAFRRETELFFASIMREDRSVLDLLTADYTFVNDRLAKHYGIPNIYGSNFRRVELGQEFDVRRGLLGKGSVLLVTALSDRTSPVQRGKWVLTNLLGTIPPDPPANVPPLRESDKTANGQPLPLEVSMRDRMEEHRVNPVCAQCHRIMDPIGFTLENFDAVGKWRTVEFGNELDVSDVLTDGFPVNGPASLRQALLRYSPQFVRSLTERLVTYALGRGVEYGDMPVVRSIVQASENQGYSFSSLVLGVVESEPFQMNRVE